MKRKSQVKKPTARKKKYADLSASMIGRGKSSKIRRHIVPVVVI